jgi:hypothetical protein
MREYHVALSFAGEDREYVERVAAKLTSDGVRVFYDRYEDVDLWGKDLYIHLCDIYENSAQFTVMFVSKAYRDKLWTNHERRSAQARALSERKEYILPAFFDESIEVPGLAKTIGRITLSERTPEQVATLIVKKLEKAGVELKQRFAYSDEAKADVDFQMIKGSPASQVIEDLRSQDWYRQSPAMERIKSVRWETVGADEAFVLGRNIYQSACGNERRAVSFLSDLRRELADIASDRAMDVLNGMLFEIYFDSRGDFRKTGLKTGHFSEILALQTVKKYEPSIVFIRRCLEPHSSSLLLLPSTIPEIVSIDLAIMDGEQPTVWALEIGGRSLLDADSDDSDRLWRLERRPFTVAELREELATWLSVPIGQLVINCIEEFESGTELRLPKGLRIRRHPQV